MSIIMAIAVNVVSFCCSLYAMNTTIVLVYVMIYAYNKNKIPHLSSHDPLFH